MSAREHVRDGLAVVGATAILVLLFQVWWLGLAAVWVVAFRVALGGAR